MPIFDAHPGPIAVVGLGYGDEGKGATVDALVRRLGLTLVVRFNGGPQAAHHVVRADGACHCFAQFGAGALVPGVATYLSEFMLVEPLALGREAEALRALGVGEPLSRVTVHRDCVVITPFHRLLGRLRELARGAARHGSCGMGVGEAYVDASKPTAPCLRFGELYGSPQAVYRKLRQIQAEKLEQAKQLGCDLHEEHCRQTFAELQREDLVDDLLAAYAPVLAAVTVDDGSTLAQQIHCAPQQIIFEGAQGALLDAEHGFWPYVTPSRVNFSGAETLLAAAGGPMPLRIGVVRAYATRHGPGPFVTESPSLAASLAEPHNLPSRWQGAMRVGDFDLVATLYAQAIVGGIDGLVMTCLDRLAGHPEVWQCNRYEAPSGEIWNTLPPAPREPTARAAWTSQVLACRPVRQAYPGWSSSPGCHPAATDYAESIADALGTPLLGIATGASAADRRWF